MGIKFRCPNGHKLNVKSFLAGKRGVCPDCQATFRIPEEPGGSDIQAVALPSLKGGNGAAVADEPAASRQREAVAQVAEPVMTTEVVISAAPVYATPVVAVAPVQPVAAMAPALPARAGIPLPTGAAVMPATGMPATGLARNGATATPRSPTVGDPIAEAPAAIWYVRPPAGGQYGPARGDVLRKWIAEARVSGDSLVWREGWTDWQSAGQLFPSLSSPAAAGGAAAGPVAVTPVAPRTTPRYAARKKSGSGMAIAALVGLILVCVVLVGVLVVVLTQQAS